MKSKFILLISVFFFSLIFNVNQVYANCSECDISDCASCGCVLNQKKDACIYSNYTKDTVSCGNNMASDIPKLLPQVISIIYNIIQVAIPVLLVVLGLMDFMKALSAQKEDNMKKSQQLFVKRLISAAIIFFAFAIVKLVISFVADGNNSDIMDCAECFIKNKCD